MPPSLYPKLFDRKITPIFLLKLQTFPPQSVYIKILYLNLYAARTKTFTRESEMGKKRLMGEANLNPLTPLDFKVTLICGIGVKASADAHVYNATGIKRGTYHRVGGC